MFQIIERAHARIVQLTNDTLIAPIKPVLSQRKSTARCVSLI